MMRRALSFAVAAVVLAACVSCEMMEEGSFRKGVNSGQAAPPGQVLFKCGCGKMQYASTAGTAPMCCGRPMTSQ